jgi:hypothetical protein
MWAALKYLLIALSLSCLDALMKRPEKFGFAMPPKGVVAEVGRVKPQDGVMIVHDVSLSDREVLPFDHVAKAIEIGP